MKFLKHVDPGSQLLHYLADIVWVHVKILSISKRVDWHPGMVLDSIVEDDRLVRARSVLQ